MVFKTKILGNLIVLTIAFLFGYFILVKTSNSICKWLVPVIATYCVCLVYILFKRFKSYKVLDGMISIETFFDTFQIKISDILWIKAIWEVSGKGNTDYIIIMKPPSEETYKIDVFLKNKNNKSLLTVLKDEFEIKVNKI